MIKAQNIIEEPPTELAYLLWQWLQEEPFEFNGRMVIIGDHCHIRRSQKPTGEGLLVRRDRLHRRNSIRSDTAQSIMVAARAYVGLA